MMRAVPTEPLTNPKRRSALVSKEECKVVFAIRPLRATFQVEREQPLVIRGVSAQADRGKFHPSSLDLWGAVHRHRLRLGLSWPQADRCLPRRRVGSASAPFSLGEATATLSAALGERGIARWKSNAQDHPRPKTVG